MARNRNWFSEFRVEDGVVHYHQTGARIPLDGALAKDVVTWLTYYVPIRLKAAGARLLRPGPRIWFTPHRPPPWYLVWNATAWIGARFAAHPGEADAAFYFEDATAGASPATSPLPCINGACIDVSKSRVAAVFEQVFGYPLALDPAQHRGPMVCKSETNGAHDGRVLQGPVEPQPGHVYQRLIETGCDALVEDLRTPCVGGEPVLVFIKRRPRKARFANFNTSVALAEPHQIFSADELRKIGAFARAMRLDWGGLDILREKGTGRLYIVDVNKTDMPPLALPFADKMRASRKLGRALDALVARLRAPAREAA